MFGAESSQREDAPLFIHLFSKFSVQVVHSKTRRCFLVCGMPCRPAGFTPEKTQLQLLAGLSILEIFILIGIPRCVSWQDRRIFFDGDLHAVLTYVVRPRPLLNVSDVSCRPRLLACLSPLLHRPVPVLQTCIRARMAPPKKPRVEGSDGSLTIGWSHLPIELLELIAAHLGFSDLVRFGSVCTTWRTAALEQRRRCRRGNEPASLRLPLLLLHRSAPGGAKLGFFSTWRGEFLDLDLPGPLSAGGVRCCGSSWGWLAMVDDVEFDICLLNPVTRARVQLPGRSHFPFRPRTAHVDDRGDPVRYLKKVVISSDPASSGCTVAAIGRSNILALCRPDRGDAWWSTFEGGHCGGYEDVAFHGDQLCALDFMGRLTICTLQADFPRVTNFAIVDPMEEVTGYPPWYRHRRLVGSSGQLLMVVRSYCPGARDASTATALRVFELGMEGWLPVQSLGDRMLFVGEVSSESMAAEDGVGVPGFRANCVCFTRRLVESAAPHAYALFCMRTERALPVSAADGHLLLEEPVWVMPTLFCRNS